MSLKPKLQLLARIMVCGLCALIAPRAFSWGDVGHTIIGGLAEQSIKPSTRDFVRGVLGIESLSVAAIWPDHARDDQRFSDKGVKRSDIDADNHTFANYHVCDIPTGYTYATKPVKTAKDCHGAILGAIEILKDASNDRSREQKIIALRYLVHVIGDIHQPLHVGNGYDIGANVCQVLWQKSPDATPAKMNLHAFWDDTIIQYLGTTYADPATNKKAAIYMGDYVVGLRGHHPEMFGEDAKRQYGSGTLDQWLSEVQQIREGGVYPDDPKQMAGVTKGEEYKHRPYCLWFTDQANNVLAPGSAVDQSQIPPLGLDYANRYAAVVETLLLKAGLRVAATLDQIADEVASAKRPVTLVDDAQQEKILSDVQDAFRKPNKN